MSGDAELDLLPPPEEEELDLPPPPEEEEPSRTPEYSIVGAAAVTGGRDFAEHVTGHRTPLIPPIAEDGSIPADARCQEASPFSHGTYIPCGAPAVAVVYHEKDRRGYYMCDSCTDHNVRNRGGVLKSRRAPQEWTPQQAADVQQVLDDSAPAVVTPLVQVLPADFPLPTLIRFVPDPRLKKEADEAAAYALTVDVRGPEGLARADRALDAVRAAQKAIEEEFKEPTDLAYSLHRRLTTLRGEWCQVAKDAIDVVGKRYAAEDRRLKGEEAEARRKAQEEADRQTREAAAREAAAARQAKAPDAVVQQLELEAETAQAPPVHVPSQLSAKRSTSVVTTQKARLRGTDPVALEQQPSMADLTNAQRASVIAAMKACIEGRQPLAVFELGWTYINQRARADKKAFNLEGFEVYEDSGTRGKSTRVR